MGQSGTRHRVEVIVNPAGPRIACTLRLLQLLPDSQDTSRHACDGGGGSRRGCGIWRICSRRKIGGSLKGATGMPQGGLKISFSDGLAVAGLVLAILLVVLDKAGKLKPGPILFLLLAVAFIMTLPLAWGNPWVVNANSVARVARGLFMSCICGVIFSGLSVWITPFQTGAAEISGAPVHETPPQAPQSSKIIYFGGLTPGDEAVPPTPTGNATRYYPTFAWQ